jgi:anthranilate phosphoribosyltransferase
MAAVSDDARSWSEALGRLVRREELSPGLVERVMADVLAGEATDAQIAAFAVALRAKGETPAELAALVQTMMRSAALVTLPGDAPVVDTCGTGGDGSGSVNVSTIAAFVVAGGGVRVAKHGNRAASSRCGSADVLEALGVAIELGPDGVVRCVEEAGMGFFFAPRYHPGLRHAARARREIGVATTFNFLGPLANPAGVRRRTIGVSDPAMAERIVAALALLGVDHALVFYGHDGLDELTTTGCSTVYELRDGNVSTYDVDATALGLPIVEPGALVGGDAAANADAVRAVLSGELGAVRDVALLNAAAAFVVAGVVRDLGAGIEAARASIDGGHAARVLDALVRVSTDAKASEPTEQRS